VTARPIAIPVGAFACAAALVLAAACSSSGNRAHPGETTTPARAMGPALVFDGQGNDLAAYSADPPFTKQIVIHHNDAAHPGGLDINGQICFDPKRPQRLVAGDDTHQDTTGLPGWGILELTNAKVGALRAKEVGRLVPTYQPGNDHPETYGCGFLDDGRILTTDVGSQATGPSDGQLIVWFPPFGSGPAKYCKVDVHLATAQGLLADGDAVYVSQSRPPRAGVYRYEVKDIPTSNTASGGCDGKDTTGAPLATHVPSTLFIAPSPENTLATPAGIAKGPNGHLYIASTFNGVIAEFTGDGRFVRDVLEPPPGETLGARPLSTGTPSGVGVAPDGSVFYADTGIVATPTGFGPGNNAGTVRRIAFDGSGNPRPPETMDHGLTFPDGIGIWQAPAP
jgi:hypothetical protein